MQALAQLIYYFIIFLYFYLPNIKSQAKGVFNVAVFAQPFPAKNFIVIFQEDFFSIFWIFYK